MRDSRQNLRRLLLVLAGSFFWALASMAQSAHIAPLATAAPPGNAALFLGVNQFDDQRLRPLSFAVNDAIAQAYVFVLQLRLIPPANCTLLLSGEPSREAKYNLRVGSDAI